MERNPRGQGDRAARTRRIKCSRRGRAEDDRSTLCNDCRTRRRPAHLPTHPFSLSFVSPRRAPLFLFGLCPPTLYLWFPLHVRDLTLNPPLLPPAPKARNDDDDLFLWIAIIVAPPSSPVCVCLCCVLCKLGVRMRTREEEDQADRYVFGTLTALMLLYLGNTLYKYLRYKKSLQKHTSESLLQQHQETSLPPAGQQQQQQQGANKEE